MIISSFPLTDDDCDFLYDLTTKKSEEHFDAEAARCEIETAYEIGKISSTARERALYQLPQEA